MLSLWNLPLPLPNATRKTSRFDYVEIVNDQYWFSGSGGLLFRMEAFNQWHVTGINAESFTVSHAC